MHLVSQNGAASFDDLRMLIGGFRFPLRAPPVQELASFVCSKRALAVNNELLRWAVLGEPNGHHGVAQGHCILAFDNEGAMPPDAATHHVKDHVLFVIENVGLHHFVEQANDRDTCHRTTSWFRPHAANAAGVDDVGDEDEHDRRRTCQRQQPVHGC